MHVLHRLNLAEQAALHMQREIEAGRWKGRLPGIARLAEELGMSRAKVLEALALVEARGLIVTQGAARHREVVPHQTLTSSNGSLRIGILHHEDPAYAAPMTKEAILTLKHDLEQLGHGVFHSSKSQIALGGDVRRITKMVEQHQADAWVVCRGSALLLDWFCKQQTPFIAVDGSIDHSPMAAASLMPGAAFREAIRQLIALGHKRIVWVCPPHWVRPAPTKMVRAFWSQLTASGLSAGDYNTPHYDGTPEGFQLLLDSLFRLTPPTAMIVPCQNHAFALMNFLNRRGLSIPHDLSLIVGAPGPALHWIHPPIAYLQYDSLSLVRRIVRWVENCAKGGLPDLDQELINATLVAGETMVPPPRG